MSRISSDDAYLIFDKWREERSPLQLVMKRPPGLRSVNSAFVTKVLPQTSQVLISALVDGEYLDVAVNLTSAQYEYEDATVVFQTLRETSGSVFWPPISPTAIATSSAKRRLSRKRRSEAAARNGVGKPRRRPR